jgi:ribosomal protein S18 acetylase RimI-like enzyme
MSEDMSEINEAYDADTIKTVRDLFEEYASSLCISLDFQDFDEELTKLPGVYSPPNGRLLIAYVKKHIVGCVALRKIDNSICEMKRLYVKPQYRGLKIGRSLTEKIIEHARQIGYSHMRLDTLPTMHEARSLYRSFGFVEIKPYRYNPIEGAVYMELKL